MLLPLFLLLSSAQFIYSSLLASKCEAFHGRSLFYKSTCYLIIDADSMCCTRVIPKVEAATKELTDSKLKQLKLLSEEESTYDIDGKTFLNTTTQLCILSALLQCPPGSELIGTKCSHLSKESKTYKEAINYCENKGMQMFYPHSDKDIKTVIEFTQANNVNEIWLSVDKQNYGHYARWFDTSRLTSTSQNIYKTLSTGKNGSTPIGYMNVVEESSTTVLPFVCASVPSTESVTTTPLTTTTSAPVTTPFKEYHCPENWLIRNNSEGRPTCYILVERSKCFDYDDARMICKQMGSFMASMKDEKEKWNIIDVLRAHHAIPSYIWLGAMDVNYNPSSKPKPNYRWEVDNSPVGSFSLWRGNDPDQWQHDTYTTEYEACMIMDLVNSDLHWHDDFCKKCKFTTLNSVNAVVCAKDADVKA